MAKIGVSSPTRERRYFTAARASSVFEAQNDLADVNFDWPHPRACATTQQIFIWELAALIIQRMYSLSDPPVNPWKSKRIGWPTWGRLCQSIAIVPPPSSTERRTRSNVREGKGRKRTPKMVIKCPLNIHGVGRYSAKDGHCSTRKRFSLVECMMIVDGYRFTILHSNPARAIVDGIVRSNIEELSFKYVHIFTNALTSSTEKDRVVSFFLSFAPWSWWMIHPRLLSFYSPFLFFCLCTREIWNITDIYHWQWYATRSAEKSELSLARLNLPSDSKFMTDWCDTLGRGPTLATEYPAQ